MHQICYLFIIWNFTNIIVRVSRFALLPPSEWQWNLEVVKTRSFHVNFDSVHRILSFYTVPNVFDIKILVPYAELGPQMRFHTIQRKYLPLHFTFRSFKRVCKAWWTTANTLDLCFFKIVMGLEARKVYDVIINHIENAQQRMSWVAAVGHTVWLGMRTRPMRGFTMILNWIIK
jgi:hypothetical protein